MKQKRLGGLCAAAIFLLCALMTGFYLIAGYGAYLDSDMASELALASHLAKEGALISSTWAYSTEVRVLSTQLVFTPLMALLRPGHLIISRENHDDVQYEVTKGFVTLDEDHIYVVVDSASDGVATPAGTR